MDFNKLKAFIVVAEELNFRRSAEILAMSQPPLTRLISSLEAELGTKLFERTTRKVSLTGAGVLLLKEAREIAASLERIESDVKHAGKLKSGVLKIGFSRTVFMARFPSLIEEFQSRFPKIKLELQEDSSQEIIKKLKTQHYDLGFVESITSDQILERHQVDAETLGVLLPKNHPLAKKKQITFNELQNETLILHHRREAEEFYDRVANLIHKMRKKPKIYIKNQNESCPILVAMGKGVSLTIPGSQHFAPEQTKFVPIAEMFLPVSVFWNKDNDQASLKTFISFIIEKRSVLSKKNECLVLVKS